MTGKLSDIYYQVSNPGSFGGVKRLRDVSKCSTAVVKDFLQAQPAYTRHKQKFSKFRRRKIVVPGMNYLWQADLIFMIKYKRFNKNFAYILSVVDTFSRKGFAIPLKNKTSSEIIRGFQEIFKIHRRTPRYLESDQGKEFFNRPFQKFLLEHSITLYHNFSDYKACMIERFNRTLLTRLAKYFTYSGSFEYLSVLPKLVESYNSSTHRSIGVSPNRVNKRNQLDVWLYAYKDLYTKQCPKTKLRLHDFVRLTIKKRAFEKGYSCTYTEEVFVITEVIDSIPVTFRIRDMTGEIIQGLFYEQELVKVYP